MKIICDCGEEVYSATEDAEVYKNVPLKNRYGIYVDTATGDDIDPCIKELAHIIVQCKCGRIPLYVGRQNPNYAEEGTARVSL